MTPRPTRKQIWRKRITRAILCLLLGAVTTVGVAWALASRDRSPALVRISVTLPPGATWPRFSIADIDGRIVGRGRTALIAGTGNWWETIVALEYGWPARAMLKHTPMSSSSRSWQTGLVLRQESEPMPLIPLWPGFLLNTLFYAAPWWFIVATPGATRRWRRRHRGRCVHCGYDLAGLPAGTVSGGTVLRTVTDKVGRQAGGEQDTARRAVPPTCPECGSANA